MLSACVSIASIIRCPCSLLLLIVMAPQNFMSGLEAALTAAPRAFYF